MKKRIGFLLGLLAGGAAAFLAFKRLDPAKRASLIDQFDDRVDQFKNHAVDYAFYANSAVSDISGQFHRRAQAPSEGRGNHAKSPASSAHPYFKTAASHLHSALSSSNHDDIVVNAGDALNVTMVYYPDGHSKPLA